MSRAKIKKYIGNIFHEAAGDEQIKDKIVDFFMKNPYPEDDIVHSFAEKLGFDPDRFETYIYSVLSDYIKGVGKHADVPDSKFDSNELKMGIDVEKEHTDSETIAKIIAKDHLVECPKYYTYLAKMEKECKKG